MSAPRTKSSAVLASIITLSVLLVFTLDKCEAKRGCSAFGHSCFGGHGKRMDTRLGSAPEEVLFGSNQQAGSGGLQDIVFTAPRNVPVNNNNAGPILESLEETNQVVRQPYIQDIYNISPFIRQWLQAYRTSQENRQNNM